MLTEKEVRDFCFDVLGDMIDPKKDIMIQEVRGEFRVIVLRTHGLPASVIRDEWDQFTKGTKFEKVALFM